jgi:hypothetical protein
MEGEKDSGSKRKTPPPEALKHSKTLYRQPSLYVLFYAPFFF